MKVSKELYHYSKEPPASYLSQWPLIFCQKLFHVSFGAEKLDEKWRFILKILQYRKFSIGGIVFYKVSDSSLVLHHSLGETFAGIKLIIEFLSEKFLFLKFFLTFFELFFTLNPSPVSRNAQSQKTDSSLWKKKILSGFPNFFNSTKLSLFQQPG